MHLVSLLVVHMAYLNSSEDVSMILGVLRIKLCIRSFRLQVAAVLGTVNSLSAPAFSCSRCPLISDSVLTWLAVIQQKTGICIDLERERERGREGGLETAVL